VRENVVAQVFGAARFYALRNRFELAQVSPVVVTSFELSTEAKIFAETLDVKLSENEPFGKYPCIKCNIGIQSGEKIYHLPFDQQYDTAVIGNVPGEFYAMTVQEAEEAGFRRAFKWQGEMD
jgi:hypothetical protein